MGLKRPLESVPDPSKITELPTLYLPGQHSQGKKIRAALALSEVALGSRSNDGPLHNGFVPHNPPTDPDSIDYGLLGKDRSTCTSEELDKIRRERNRMHAKRTRDRKRVYMEEMEALIVRLQEENQLLEQHYLKHSGGGIQDSPICNEVTHIDASLPSNVEERFLQPTLFTNSNTHSGSDLSQPQHLIPNDQLKSLSNAVCTFGQELKQSDLSATSTVTAALSSSHDSASDDEDDGSNSVTDPRKRQKCGY